MTYYYAKSDNKHGKKLLMFIILLSSFLFRIIHMDKFKIIRNATSRWLDGITCRTNQWTCNVQHVLMTNREKR